MAETNGTEVVLSPIQHGKADGSILQLKAGDKVPGTLSDSEKDVLRSAGAIGKPVAVVNADEEELTALKEEIASLKADLAAKNTPLEAKNTPKNPTF